MHGAELFPGQCEFWLGIAEFQRLEVFCVFCDIVCRSDISGKYLLDLASTGPFLSEGWGRITYGQWAGFGAVSFLLFDIDGRDV